MKVHPDLEPQSLLLVEDQPGDRRLVVMLLRHAPAPGYRIYEAASMAEAKKQVSLREYDACLLDLTLPDAQGLDSVRQMREAAPDLPIVVLTGIQDQELALETLREGGQDFLYKSFDANPESLLRALRYACERAKLERALRNSEERFRDLAESSADWFWEQGPDLRFTYVSPRFEELTGLPPRMVLERSRGELPGVDVNTPVWDVHLLRLTLRQPFKGFEYWMTTPEGEERCLRVNGKPVFDRHGTFEGYRGTGTDVTKLRKAERDLESGRQLLMSVVDDQTDLICRFDPDGKITFANLAFRSFFSLGEAVGLSLIKATPATVCSALVNGALQLRDRKQMAQSEVHLTRQDGDSWVMWRTRALVHQGKLEYQSVGNDITLIKQQERKLRELADNLAIEKERAEEATRVKSDFLAAMSHEIRTPLTGVLGVADLLRDTPLNQQQSAYVGTIAECGQTLLGVINDILDLAKLEAGKLRIETIDYIPRETLDAVVQLMQGKAEEKNLSLDLRLKSDVPNAVQGDPLRLRQILFNLIGNGLKFTEKGGVTVSVDFQPTADGWHLLCDVSDTGIGIRAEILPNLFSDFAQADASTTRRYGGTGLGLAICKRLIQQMGGTIGIRSTEGLGTVVSFELPLGRAAHSDMVTKRRSTGQSWLAAEPLKILLAEDNAVNQMLISALLTRMGHHVDVVGDGCQALDAVLASPYDVVLMDAHMPEMDGSEATRHIRSAEQSNPNRRRQPIIGVTADAMSEFREHYLGVGMDFCIAKPIDRNELMETINLAVGRPIHRLNEQPQIQEITLA